MSEWNDLSEKLRRLGIQLGTSQPLQPKPAKAQPLEALVPGRNLKTIYGEIFSLQHYPTPIPATPSPHPTDLVPVSYRTHHLNYSVLNIVNIFSPQEPAIYLFVRGESPTTQVYPHPQHALHRTPHQPSPQPHLTCSISPAHLEISSGSAPCTRTRADFSGSNRIPIGAHFYPSIFSRNAHTGIFYHNEIDVLSLSALFGWLAAILEDPSDDRLTDPEDLLSVGRVLETLERERAAEEVYASQRLECLSDEERQKSLLMRARLQKRRGNLEEASALWKQAALTGSIEALLDWAKYYEPLLRITKPPKLTTKRSLNRSPPPPLLHANPFASNLPGNPPPQNQANPDLIACVLITSLRVYDCMFN